MTESTTLEAGGPGRVPPSDGDALVAAFKALGDPTRLGIVAVLRDGTRCVCEIQAVIDVPGNLLSHHLKVLRDAGLIRGRRRGRWIDYSLVEGTLGALRSALPPEPASLGLDLSACAVACGREDDGARRGPA